MTTQKQSITFLTSEEANGLPYSPALLLDARLSVSVTDDRAFSDGCMTGFDGYYDLLYHDAEDFRPVEEMPRFLIELAEDDGPVWLDKLSGFRWNIGYGLGWLSALACSQYQEAMEGLALLRHLVECSGNK